MVLPQSYLDDLLSGKPSLHADVVEARVLITQAETSSTADTTNIKIGHRVIG
jgi:hypothetical protein